MKTRSVLTGCLTFAAIAACLIPLLAQEPVRSSANGEILRSNDPADFAQRQAADLYAATLSSAQNAAAQQAPGFPGPMGQNGPWQQGQNSPPAPLPGSATTRSLFGPSAFDPELAKAINESNQVVGQLIKQLKETEEDSEKELIKDKIKTELDVQYDAYLDHHEKPLKQLEERVAKLRKEFEARKQAKTDLVKLRLDTIWYDSQGLGWPSNRTTIWRNNVNQAPSLIQNLNSFGSSYPANNRPAAIPGPPNPPTPPAPPAFPTQPGR